MSRYVVPQFIDVEDKILGPMTIRQFSIILLDALIMFIVFKLSSLGLMLLINLPLLAIGLVFAFMRVNGQPFHFFMLNVLQTRSRPNIRIWNKELSDAQLREYIKIEPPPPPAPKPYKEAPTTSRLSELALIVNTGGAYHSEES